MHRHHKNIVTAGQPLAEAGRAMVMAPGRGATAAKGGHTYPLTGKATGVAMANPTQPPTQRFATPVTCP